jgi:hypothetical protein
MAKRAAKTPPGIPYPQVTEELISIDSLILGLAQFRNGGGGMEGFENNSTLKKLPELLATNGTVCAMLTHSSSSSDSTAAPYLPAPRSGCAPW